MNRITETTALTTTFKELHGWRACKPSYKTLAKELGGIESYGKNTPIKLSQILDICGIDDCFWVLERKTLNTIYVREIRLFGCDCAERVLHIFESEHPNDHRPRQAIEAAQRYARNEIGREELTLAWDAALDAGDAGDAWAARAAAWAAWAARAAARDAEIATQTQMLRNVLLKLEAGVLA